MGAETEYAIVALIGVAKIGVFLSILAFAALRFIRGDSMRGGSLLAFAIAAWFLLFDIPIVSQPGPKDLDRALSDSVEEGFAPIGEYFDRESRAARSNLLGRLLFVTAAVATGVAFYREAKRREAAVAIEAYLARKETNERAPEKDGRDCQNHQ